MSFSFRSWPLRAVVLAAAAGTASAGNITYSFNANPGAGWSVSDALGISGTAPSAWEWTSGPSVDEGGWHARYGAEAAGTATVLESPYFKSTASARTTSAWRSSTATTSRRRGLPP